uniref:Uncharacterized protein n=1 Tax=Neobodo designis TaxID=312471 RepID=A0A7S1KX10_NEODS|eukprot:CAMPEP_0174846868 /NCGR_PEP_ID=MMETSP1114-20130205/12563_1 /TAXON_ID=312471 /ORGANISM="Neobodo designis, Strain CCAP 1951/1" /LENGTH=522 /DNA_ID=CAMNT_0016081139 /DNA_START=40 /DNA_END=1608 /DNA_ORIENTATION=+
MSEKGTSKPPAKRAPAGDFDKQLFNLRMKLAGSSGVRPPPAECTAPLPPRQSNSAPSSSSLNAANLARVGGSAAPIAVPPAPLPAPAGQPAAAPSALLAFLDHARPSDDAAATAAGASPTDPTAYLRHAVGDFAAACSAIEDFEYDLDVEAERQLQDQLRRAAADPSQPAPRFPADPFDFRDARVGHGGAAAAVSGVNRRFAAAKPSAAPSVSPSAVSFADDNDVHTVPSQSAGATSVSAVAVLERQKQLDAARSRQTAARISSSANSELYALPDDVARRHNVKPQLDVDVPGSVATRRSTSNTRRSSSTTLSKAPSPPPAASASKRPPLKALPPGPSPAAESLDFSHVRQIQFRDPAVVVPVSDGRIAFCVACHRVVIGSGRGRCPHCGHVNDVDGNSPIDEPGARKNAAETQAVDTGGAAEMQPRELGPDASIAEVEAEERRQFQAAVAAWRSGKGVVAEVAAEAAPAEGTAPRSTAFERSAALVARDVRTRATGAGSALYFQRLWHAAFPAHGDGVATA